MMLNFMYRIKPFCDIIIGVVLHVCYVSAVYVVHELVNWALYCDTVII